MNKKLYIVSLPNSLVLPLLLGNYTYVQNKSKNLGPSEFRFGTNAVPLVPLLRGWCSIALPGAGSARRVSTGTSLLLFTGAIKHMLSFKRMIVALKSIGPKSAPKLNVFLNPAGV